MDRESGRSRQTGRLQELLRMERSHRRKLSLEPDSVSARMDLAWSLVLQSIYISGMEDGKGPCRCNNTHRAGGKLLHPEELVRAATIQVCIVAQTANTPTVRREAQRLQSVIDGFYNQSGFAEALDDLDLKLASLLRDIKRAPVA